MNGMYIPPLRGFTKILVIVSVGIFLLNSISSLVFGMDLSPFLSLHLESLKLGLVTTLLTYPFVQNGLFSILFSALILWFIGSELETHWGRRFYIKFITLVALVTGIFFLLVVNMGLGINASLSGLNGINFALLIAYGMIYKDRTLSFMLIFPMRALYFCLLLVGVEFYSALFSQNKASSLSHLAAILFAYLYLTYLSKKAKGLKRGNVAQKRRKNTQGLHIVVDNEEKSDPKNPRYWQ